MANHCDNTYVITSRTERITSLYEILNTASTSGDADGWVVPLLDYVGEVDVNPDDFSQPIDTRIAVEKVDEGHSRLIFGFDTKWSPMSEVENWLWNAADPDRFEQQWLELGAEAGVWRTFEGGELVSNRELSHVHDVDDFFLCVWSDGKISDWSFEDVDLEGLSLEDYVARYGVDF